MQDYFAHGCDHFDGYDCPAVAVGREPTKEKVVLDVVDLYDEHAYDASAPLGSLLTREEAEEAWNKTIAEIEERRNAAETDPKRRKYDEMYRAARDIAKALGWD